MQALTKLRIFSLTSAGSGPYPTTSPRQTATSQLPATLASAVSRAVELAWISLRIKMRIGKVRRVQSSIDEPARGCTGRKNSKADWTQQNKKRCRVHRKILRRFDGIRLRNVTPFLFYEHLSQLSQK